MWLLAAAVCAVLAGTGWLLDRSATPRDPAAVVLALLAAGFTPFGVFVLRRLPGQPLGRLMLLGGLSAAVAAVATSWSATQPAAWLSQWTWWPPYAVIPLLVLLAPDGTLPSRRWRPLAVLLVASGALATLALAAVGLVQPDGFLVRPDAPLTAPARTLLLVAAGAGLVELVACVGVVAAVVVRWRAGDRTLRGQLVCLVPVLAVVLLSIGLAAMSPFAYSWVPAVLVLPLAVTVAVLRYQLHDLDLYIHRGVVWLALTALAVLTYAGVVTAAGALLARPGSPVASILGAAAVAAFLQPGQRLVHRGVGRLLYGRRDEPYAVLTALSRQVGTVRDPLAVLPEIADTVVASLRVPYAAVRVLGEDGTPTTAAECGRWAGPPVGFPMTARGEAVGELLVAPRRPGAAFTGEETRLLRDLAGQAALAADACRSALALQQARDRLVLAREEERRRLRRDLHDGVASALVGTRMIASAMRGALPPDGPGPALLDTLTGDLDACTAEVRTLIDGLRPAALDDGLAAALTELTGRFGDAPAVALEIDGDLTELPAAVEVVAYRVAGEALTNVVKHARARHVRVRVRRDERHLELQVADDGGGFGPGADRGVGLTSIHGRVDELGGRCDLRSGADGTTVTALLPLHA